jgi:NhaC family Na+:H+ antiporter
MAEASLPEATENRSHPLADRRLHSRRRADYILATSYLLHGDKASQGPNQVALGFCALIASGIAVKNGMPWSGIRQATVDGVAAGLSAIFILLAVGSSSARGP